MDKDKLYQMYIIENRRRKEIAKIFGVSESYIKKLLSKYNIKKDPSQYRKLIDETSIKKYGDRCSLMNDAVWEKAKKTIKERYGEDHPMKSEDVQSRVRKTNIRKYGSPYLLQNYEIAYKQRQAMKKKYGFENTTKNYKFQKMMHPNLTKKTWSIISNKENMESFLKRCKDKKYTIGEIAQLLNCNYNTIQYKIKKWDLQKYIILDPKYSLAEINLRHFLDINHIKYIINDRKILDNGLEIDIFCPEQKIGIEFNGEFWHSIDNKKESYHQEKTLDALNKGIYLFHYWENDSDNSFYQLKELLSHEEKDFTEDEYVLDLNYENPIPLMEQGYTIEKISGPNLIIDRFICCGAGYAVLKRGKIC